MIYLIKERRQSINFPIKYEICLVVDYASPKKSDKERKKYRFLVQSAKWWNRIIGRSIVRHIVRVDRLIWSLVVFFSPHALSGSGSVLKKNSWIRKREKKWIEGDVWVTDTPLTRHLWNSRDTVGSGRGIYDTRYWPSSYLIAWGKLWI